MADRGSLTDPKSWGDAISKISTPTATATMTILALLALLGYLAFQGVPAVMALTNAIQHNTDTTSNSALRQEQNQATIIGQHGAMISQNTDLINVVREQQEELTKQETRLEGLEADEYARRAHDVLRKR